MHYLYSLQDPNILFTLVNMSFLTSVCFSLAGDKRQHVLKERFILTNGPAGGQSPAPLPSPAPAQEPPSPLVGRENKELSQEQVASLRQCRNRAYSKVLGKKRLHLTASLSAYLQKEWQGMYPNSLLTGNYQIPAAVYIQAFAPAPDFPCT